MSLESWKSFFEIGGVVLLFLTFAFGTGALLTGKVVNQRQENQLRRFDSDLTTAKTALSDQQERNAEWNYRHYHCKNSSFPKVQGQHCYMEKTESVSLTGLNHFSNRKLRLDSAECHSTNLLWTMTRWR